MKPVFQQNIINEKNIIILIQKAYPKLEVLTFCSVSITSYSLPVFFLKTRCIYYTARPFEFIISFIFTLSDIHISVIIKAYTLWNNKNFIWIIFPC